MQIRRWNALAISLLLTAGIVFAPPCVSESRFRGGDGELPSERLAQLEPAIVAFVAQCDRDVIARGRSLTEDEAELARNVGVLHPERVRILVSDTFPEPDDPTFAREISHLGPAHPIAETTGYGIELIPRVAHSRRILLHELTHVGQFERMGVSGFMHAYLTELTTVGYRGSSLEAQAQANERL